MMPQTDIHNTVKRLEVAVTDRLLDGDILGVGRTLLEHLQKPTQITAVGQPGSGKSSLVRMLLGGMDLPSLSGVTIFELRGGDAETVEYEDLTGAVQTSDGRATDLDLPDNLFRVIQTLPLPHLAERRLADVTWPSDKSLQSRVMDWLVETSDITVWCSEDFDDAERARWGRFPESLKDHGFLALTKADQLQMKGTLSTQTASFEEQDCEDFLALYPVASKQAIAAHKDGVVEDASLWAASGGKALYEGLAHQIDIARRADLDYADMLLARLPEIKVEDTPATEPAPAARETERLAPMQRTEAVETALTILQDCADGMSVGDATPEPKDVLSQSAQAAQALATLFMDAGAEDPQVNAIRDGVLESEQMIMLLQLEGTETAACDAVGALLQLKKEMSEVAYA